jgi:hypothetical protein
MKIEQDPDQERIAAQIVRLIEEEVRAINPERLPEIVKSHDRERTTVFVSVPSAAIEIRIGLDEQAWSLITVVNRADPFVLRSGSGVPDDKLLARLLRLILELDQLNGR